MLNPILILAHWHTASSLVAYIFNQCGMWVGNEKTGWNKDCIGPTEHSIINGAGVQIERGELVQENKLIISNTMMSFELEAVRLGYNTYGFKTTHALQSKIWSKTRNIFLEQWNNPTIIIPIQHPMNIISTLRKRPHGFEWLDEDIMKSWLSIKDTVIELSKNTSIFVIDMPSSFKNDNEGIKKVINKVGLTWNEKCDNLYCPDRVVKYTKEHVRLFEERFPEQIHLYEYLKKFM